VLKASFNAEHGTDIGIAIRSASAAAYPFEAVVGYGHVGLGPEIYSITVVDTLSNQPPCPHDPCLRKTLTGNDYSGPIFTRHV
jgi:hypothetical protein